MRMQLIKTIALALLVMSVVVSAQEKTKKELAPVEVDFLFNYYEQDGNHSAVQGGVGDQNLTDRVGSIKVKMPLDSNKIVAFSLSLDGYSSASSDNIDPSIATISSASYSDVRAYGNGSFTLLKPNDNSYTLGAGFSKEYDVTSISANAAWAKGFNNNNQVLSIAATGLYDKWMQIYPIEMRKRIDPLKDNVRKTFGANLSYAVVLNKRMQMSVTYDFIYQQGLLSTPFHRVVFDTTGIADKILQNQGVSLFEHDANDDGNIDVYDYYQNHEVVKSGFPVQDIERLPDFRHKHAFGVRNNWYPLSWMIVRSYARYYFDSFGIESFTGSIEVPVKLSRFFSFYPFYRYYSQSAADYFRPILQHNSTDEFYTSDYDLSKFDSHKIGLGMRISPAFGIYHKENGLFGSRDFSFKSFDLRVAQYTRSDGLDAYIITAGFGFEF